MNRLVAALAGEVREYGIGPETPWGISGDVTLPGTEVWVNPWQTHQGTSSAKEITLKR